MASSARPRAASLALYARASEALRSTSVVRAWSISLSCKSRWMRSASSLETRALQGIALVGDVVGAPVVVADILGLAEQVLARFDQELLGRLRARLQGVEAHALGGELVIVRLVGGVDRIHQPPAFVGRAGELASTWCKRVCEALRLASVSVSLRPSRAASALPRLLALQPSRFHGAAGECSLIGCELHFHRYGSFP